jgi:hypothetical protein
MARHGEGKRGGELPEPVLRSSSARFPNAE